MGVLKFSQLGLLRLLQAHNFTCKPLINRRSIAKLYPSLRLSNAMSGDSRLLMIGSQIGNLIPDPSFGHNYVSDV